MNVTSRRFTLPLFLRAKRKPWKLFDVIDHRETPYPTHDP
jgi:hypothetical protein